MITSALHSYRELNGWREERTFSHPADVFTEGVWQGLAWQDTDVSASLTILETLAHLDREIIEKFEMARGEDC
jgi:hypothetical protein